MTDLTRILTDHATRYPQMRPQDAVKLLYQNEFGGGHLISDPAAALERLRTEYAGVAHDPSAPLLEDIGNGLVRVMLTALDTKSYPPESLNADFVRSAQQHSGSLDAFQQKLSLLAALTEQNLFSFSTDELTAYLTDYKTAGCPAVSHSQAYRDAYHPAYRVVLRTCLPPALQILCEVVGRKGNQSTFLIAIDGRCASGKTTLAGQLQAACGCSVVHLDDFFLRPEQRTQARLDTPGENIDHERFLSEALLPLSRGQAAQYRPFDCSTQTLGRPVLLDPSPVVIVEGSYSCHPALWPHYDLRVFLSVDPEEQMRRIITRNGSRYAEIFCSKWIPLEEQYFAAYSVQERCDLSFETGKRA